MIFVAPVNFIACYQIYNDASDSHEASDKKTLTKYLKTMYTIYKYCEGKRKVIHYW